MRRASSSSACRAAARGARRVTTRPRRPRRGTPRRAGSARLPAGARRASDAARSRSRAGAPSRARASRPRRTCARRRRRPPRPRARAGAAARSACTSSASPRRVPVSAARRSTITVPMPSTAVADALMETLVIEGSQPLNGRIRAAGNKNGALPILAACLLTTEPVTLRNVPHIRDVETMLELLADVGAAVEWLAPNEVRVHAAEVVKYELDEELCSRIRASFLLAGPLLARCGRVSVPPPGGDVIGRRRLDPHIHALRELGAEISANGRYEMQTAGLRAKPIFLDEASVMATENTVMAAALAEGETVIGNAACEPHVQDLCRFLVSLGAQIDGIETNVLRVRGVDRLGGGEWEIGPDHIEVASFIGLGAITDGELVIEGCRAADMIAITPVLERLGIRMEIEDSTIRVPDGQDLAIQDDLGGH